MQSKNSNLYTVPLQPGVNVFNHPGRFFRLVESPVPLGVKLGDMSQFTMRAGQGVPLEKGEEFPRYELTNPLGTIVRVTYWLGYVDFTDNKVDQIEAATEFAPVENVAGVYEDGVLAPNAYLDLVGAITPGRIRRKAVQVFNLSPDANILLVLPSMTRVVVSGAGLAAANGTYTLDAATGRWLKSGGYYIEKAVVGSTFGLHAPGGAKQYVQAFAFGAYPWSSTWEEVFGASPAPTVAQLETTGGVVRPGETITQPVSGPIRVKNATGAGVACWLSEIWWTP